MEEIDRDGDQRIVISPDEGDVLIRAIDEDIASSKRQIKGRLATILIWLFLGTFLVGAVAMGEMAMIGPLGVVAFWTIFFTVKIVGLVRRIQKFRMVRDRLLVQMGKFEISRVFQGEDA